MPVLFRFLSIAYYDVRKSYTPFGWVVTDCRPPDGNICTFFTIPLLRDVINRDGNTQIPAFATVAESGVVKQEGYWTPESEIHPLNGAFSLNLYAVLSSTGIQVVGVDSDSRVVMITEAAIYNLSSAQYVGATVDLGWFGLGDGYASGTAGVTSDSTTGVLKFSITQLPNNTVQGLTLTDGTSVSASVNVGVANVCQQALPDGRIGLGVQFTSIEQADAPVMIGDTVSYTGSGVRTIATVTLSR